MIAKSKEKRVNEILHNCEGGWGGSYDQDSTFIPCSDCKAKIAEIEAEDE